MSSLRVILAHDWLTGMRGGEKVLEVFCRRWPKAPLYTLLHRRGSCSPLIEQRSVRTSWLGKLPGVHRYYRHLLPLMPSAVGWRLPESDLVLSSSHCVIKGIQAPDGTPHVSYCHTPMRYAWGMRDAYFQRRGLKAWMIDRILDRLREWDRRTSAGVTRFIANSQVVRRRIQDAYGRDSAVVHPPVDTEYFTPTAQPREDFYLAMSAMAPYKRLDLAVEACHRTGRKLVVIGSGQDEKKLRSLASDRIQFLGWQPDDAVREHLRRCQALLFPGEEDFGIVPVEAQACGTPVICLGRGGATETVVPLGQPKPTGVWFADQNGESLIDALDRFEKNRDAFMTAQLREHALKFRVERFEFEMFSEIDRVLGRGGQAKAA